LLKYLPGRVVWVDNPNATNWNDNREMVLSMASQDTSPSAGNWFWKETIHQFTNYFMISEAILIYRPNF